MFLDAERTFLVRCHMQMDMHDLLPPFFPNVELELVARDIHLVGEIASEEKESSDRIAITVRKIGDGLYMTLRDEEHMNPCLRMNVVQHDVIVVFIDRIDRIFTSDELTE